tara:strand:+ start:52 stop:210 length:159 start_codon:yes stop_codon:yes gene_type:complete
MNIKERINHLEEEAQANLTLFRKGQDGYAITRYQRIMEQITNLRKYGNDSRS